MEQVERVVGVDKHACGYGDGNSERNVRAFPHADPYSYRDNSMPDGSQTLTSLVMTAARRDVPHAFHNAVAHSDELIPAIDHYVLLRAVQEEIVADFQRHVAL